MSFNSQGAIPVAQSIFGGLVTESAPTDLTEGLSPANNDVSYLPGSVSMRAALKKIFSTPIPASTRTGLLPTITYAKSYVDPTGDQKNLYLTSNGEVYYEDVGAAPGVYVKITGTLALNLYGKSVTVSGREIIAVSDGLHGAEVPLQYNGVTGLLSRFTQDGPGAPPTVVNTLIAASTNSELVRAGGIVTATTATAHGLQVGYQTQIAGATPAYLGGGIASIVINNEALPGLATVTMSSAHGLVPNDYVSIFGVNPVTVGGSLTSLVRYGGIVTATTSTAHGLYPGSIITPAGMTGSGTGTAAPATFNGTFVVLTINNANIFTYAQNEPDAQATGGTISIAFPVTSGITPEYFQVLSCPTPTTFQIQLSYSDATWTSGSVTFQWDGTFFVASVIDAYNYTYSQPGPSANTTGGTPGTTTPYGQISPGVHQVRVSYITVNGYITRPSPPATFTAPGGQYITISNIPIGPNGPQQIVGRVLQFTGTGGAYFFYIPVQAQINGQVVSSATQINDNTTTSVTLDFSDNTLFSAIGTSTPGNDLANQIVLEGALGFAYYAGRVIAYGCRNRVLNLQNMGFDGGAMPSTPTVPSGWSYNNDGHGSLSTSGHVGASWKIQVNGAGATIGQITQGAYQDAYGAPIATPNTPYRLRLWANVGVPVSGFSVVASLNSPTTGFQSTATISATSIDAPVGGWYEANFGIPTPLSIPADLTLSVYVAATSSLSVATYVLIDEVSLLYAAKPYLDTVCYASYVNNPEAFDGVSGKFGPSSDIHKIMEAVILRDTLYLGTQDPGGRLHEVLNNKTSEPAGWTVREVQANCGFLSAFCTTKSQADDNTAAGGEDWFAWASSTGARIFSGQSAWKFSQEIQPNWTGQPDRGFGGIAFGSQLTCWTLNDPVERKIYFGVPSYDVSVGSRTAPNCIFVMSYRGLEGAYEIAYGKPGKYPVTDDQRKWTIWNVTANGAALLYRFQNSQLYPTFLNGNAETPGAAAGTGNAYTLSYQKYTDDDFGQISPSYTTHFYVDPELAIKLKLTAARQMLSYLTASVSGIGNFTIQPLVNNLTNPWRLSGTRALVANPTRDIEWGGGSATGNRIAFQFSVSPITGTDNDFQLSRLVAYMKDNAHTPVAGR